MKLVIENIVVTSVRTQEILLDVWNSIYELDFTSDGKFDTVILENDEEKITYNFPSKDVTNKIVQRKEED
jgi:hypothetical protein|tara:strand:+ start:804 stop:1013 length:210 start_codon:yes stop_codon:yes gene_type:complete